MASTTVPNPAPAGSAAQSKMVYRVKRGDTLSSIARVFQTSVASLKKWNSLADQLASRRAAAHDSDHCGRHRNALIKSFGSFESFGTFGSFSFSRREKARVNSTPGFFF